MRAFVFPGQGSQSVGMGKSLAEASPVAREVFQEVDDALGQHLFRLMCEGPEGDLTLTENAQPAIMANAIATLRVFEKEGGVVLAEKAHFVAGHSLGEYSALCAAGALDLSTTAKLLKLRGQAMQAAVPVGEGAMAALLGADIEKAEALAAAAAQVKEHGIKRGISLPVSAPFHCPLMQPAADRMAEALAQTSISAPYVPVFANVVAAPVSQPDDIRRLLVEQVTGRVRWRESAIAMRDAGVTHFHEFGGKVLSPMIKRSAGDEVTATSILSMDDIEAILKEI
jgi:[acyl-carrier-protein] S-malonyltransferase